MRILLLASAYNSLTQRVHAELADRGHQVAVELALGDEVMRAAVRRHGPDLVIAPMLTTAIPADVSSAWPCFIVHPRDRGRGDHRPAPRRGLPGHCGRGGLDSAVNSTEAMLPDPARGAVFEIGDRLQRLHEALASSWPTRSDWRTDELSESLVAAALRETLDPYLDLLSREIGFGPRAPWRAASRYLHDRIGELIDLSPVAARCFHKPLGYAGDFEMMNMIYRNESLGDTLFGRSLSRALLDSDAAHAVRNRVHYLAAKIRTTAGRGGPGRPIRLLSVAAGPAMELRHLLRKDPELLATGRAEITLVDQDASALRHAREQIEAVAAQAGIEVTLRSLNTSIRSVIVEGLDDCYDLIYSAGLFDYLKDRTARAAATRLVNALAPEGQAVLGNFGTVNPSRPILELILDWPLLHRSASDLRELFGDIGTDVTVEQEAAGINLFAVISA